jgi:hypothetical protein
MSAAERILAEMRRTKTGWTPSDFRSLYEGFGFTSREGGNHTLYKHPRFPHLRGTVARHRKLAPFYAEQAVECIDELRRLQAQEEPESGSD